MSERNENAGTAAIDYASVMEEKSDISKEYITFLLGSEEYGIEITTIYEIIRYQVSERLPNVPDYIEGMINLRGNIVPIFDLRKKFNLLTSEQDKENVIIVIEIMEKSLGIIADSVSDIVRFSDDELQEAVVAQSQISIEYVKGIGKNGESMIIILDLERFFDEIFKELSN